MDIPRAADRLVTLLTMSDELLTDLPKRRLEKHRQPAPFSGIAHELPGSVRKLMPKLKNNDFSDIQLC